MLIICDIDGTLTDTTQVDTLCFVASLKDVAGIDLEISDWNSFPEATDSAIISELLKGSPQEEINAIEQAVRKDFVERLKAEAKVDSDQFRALPGAVEFIKTARSRANLGVAIATGGWDESARFKLQMAGVDTVGLAMATSSDRTRRAEIIQLAAHRANRPLTSAVYLGDGLWDLKAARELKIDLIGIGHQSRPLFEAGASAAFNDLQDASTVLNCIETLKSI
jgi:beta-phosphoglucomutase-like phosphatase (HAD superfamily)